MAALLPTEPRPFVARRLSPALLREADLVLAMSREHRQRIVEIFPAALRRTFTLREFARILELPEISGSQLSGSPGDRLGEMVNRAAALRPRARRPDPADDDVADPYREAPGVYADSLALITEAVAGIARAFGR